jgi:hypothetical protein
LRKLSCLSILRGRFSERIYRGTRFFMKTPKKSPEKSPAGFSSVLAVLALTSLAATGAAAEELKAADVIKKHIQALGGQEALDKHSCQSTRGTIEVQGLSGTYESYKAAPAREHQKIDLKVVVQEHAVDGNKGWKRDQSGLREVKGAELDGLRESATFNRILRFDDPTVFKNLEVVGRETVEGRPALKVAFTLASGKTYNAYYDAETFLQVKQEAQVSKGKNEFLQQVYLSDFRVVDGVKLPFKSRQVTPFNETLIKIDKIEFCSTVDEQRFAMPAAAP